MRSVSPVKEADDDEPIRLASAPHAVSQYWVENVSIQVWHEAPTAAVVNELYAKTLEQRERYPTGMSFVYMGPVRSALIDGAARAALGHISKELGGYVAGVALVTKASGFLASTLRSIVTGIMVMSPAPYELRIHEKVEDVFEWLPQKHLQITGVALDLERLRRVMFKADASVG